MGKTSGPQVRVLVRPLRQEAEALADVVLAAFEGWMSRQPNGLALQAAYVIVVLAVEEDERVSCREAAQAAELLAEAATRGPYADYLTCLFDGLADAWRLGGSGPGFASGEGVSG